MTRTEEVVDLQIRVMGGAVYEVGLYKPLVSQGAVMLTRTWDVDAILKSVTWLRFQNSAGRNIYIRPKGEHHLSLVDDLTRNSIERMKAAGFQPSIVVETSPGNFQAWLNHGRVLPNDLSTATARSLAESFGGDTKAAAWRQYGRLAGFTNRKPSHMMPNGLFPFVKLIEATACVYDKADEFLSDIAAKLERTKAEAAALREKLAVASAGAQGRRLKGIRDFRENPLYRGDGNRIDLAYAVYALSHGVADNDVRQAIASRDLSKKGSELRRQQYVERTIAKARARVGLSR